MMAVDIAPGDRFRAGRAATLIDPWPYTNTVTSTSHDVLADGSFVATMDAGPGSEGAATTPNQRSRLLSRVGEIHVVLNFFEELRGRGKAP